MRTPQQRQQKVNAMKAAKTIKRTNKNILICDIVIILTIGVSVLSIITLF